MKPMKEKASRRYRGPRWWLGAALGLSPQLALADVAPDPPVVVSLLQLVNWFAFLPFTGVYTLAYIVVLLRKDRLPGLTLLGTGHVALGLVLAIEEPTLGVVQAAIGLFAVGLDRLVHRAVLRRKRALVASESGFSMPTMSPITTTASRSTMDELNEELGTTSSQPPQNHPRSSRVQP